MVSLRASQLNGCGFCVDAHAKDLAAAGEPAVRVNLVAALVHLVAMINAAKADGQIDAQEQEKIISRLGDIDSQEAAFIRDEISKPLNFDFFADITQDLTPQIYAVSLMAITPPSI